jgi:hypothetical protein
LNSVGGTVDNHLARYHHSKITCELMLWFTRSLYRPQLTVVSRRLNVIECQKEQIEMLDLDTFNI